MTPNRTDPNRMRELGRRGGKASGEARRKRKSRGFLDALRDRVNERPEELVDALMRSPPGAVVAARVLEKAGGLVPEPEPQRHPAARDDIPPATHGLRELVERAYRDGLAAALGLPTTPAELERLMKGTPTPAEDRGTPVPSRAPLTVAHQAAADTGTPEPPSKPPADTAAPPESGNAAERQVAEIKRQRRELGRSIGERDPYGDDPPPPRDPRILEL